MKVVAFTGAGISKSAGIPTFEEVDGLKAKLSVEFRDEHPQEFAEALKSLKKSVEGKEPTKAHKALASLPIPIITMNVDGLHQKAGSRQVFEIHGNYKDDNIVLYGENIHFKDEVIALIIKTAEDAKRNNEEAVFLIIGTSMQTTFAVFLALLAKQRGMNVHYINDNADEEVPMFLNKYVFLPTVL
ncbi:MAG: hypothetical protein K6A44_02400 [bacterium]|nr:hypothetical protein [bacterium]